MASLGPNELRTNIFYYRNLKYVAGGNFTKQNPNIWNYYNVFDYHPLKITQKQPYDISSAWNGRPWPDRSQNWMLMYFIINLSGSQQFSGSSIQNQVELSEWATGRFMHCISLRPISYFYLNNLNWKELNQCGDRWDPLISGGHWVPKLAM